MDASRRDRDMRQAGSRLMERNGHLTGGEASPVEGGTLWPILGYPAQSYFAGKRK